MIKSRIFVATLAILGSIFIGMFSSVSTYAAIDPLGDACSTTAGGKSAICNGASPTGGEAEIQNIVNLLLFILGVIAVIMIIVGGIRYATSGGDANGIKSAKDTILYSVVGLIVALLAYTIVNFVLGRF